mmetsp:Transcript_44692/g.133555  ORF Transcript_44692/g.133555 Transcript_44692/m.133555 type:complete len:255 (+) Transcript_44692:87-851(+)
MLARVSPASTSGAPLYADGPGGGSGRTRPRGMRYGQRCSGSSSASSCMSRMMRWRRSSALASRANCSSGDAPLSLNSCGTVSRCRVVARTRVMCMSMSRCKRSKSGTVPTGFVSYFWFHTGSIARSLSSSSRWRYARSARARRSASISPRRRMAASLALSMRCFVSARRCSISYCISLSFSPRTPCGISRALNFIWKRLGSRFDLNSSSRRDSRSCSLATKLKGRSRSRDCCSSSMRRSCRICRPMLSSSTMLS